jgi:ABC-type phosphate/phosphonate transport system substrate-binding protein
MEHQPRLERQAVPTRRDARHRCGLADQDRRGHRRARRQACRSQESYARAREPRQRPHAAILPVYFLQREGLVENKDYRTLRFNSDLGKHGDTGASESEVVRAILDGRADAGAIGSRFWNAVRTEHLVPEGALTEIWTSRPYNHYMFTARSDLDPALEQAFAKALFAMSFDNPVLEAEGLRQWIAPQLAAYAELREASAQLGFLQRPLA